MKVAQLIYLVIGNKCWPRRPLLPEIDADRLLASRQPPSLSFFSCFGLALASSLVSATLGRDNPIHTGTHPCEQPGTWIVAIGPHHTHRSLVVRPASGFPSSCNLSTSDLSLETLLSSHFGSVTMSSQLLVCLPKDRLLEL